MKYKKTNILITVSLIFVLYQLMTTHALAPNVNPLPIKEEAIEISKEYVAEYSESEGIINTKGRLSLDTKYKPINKFLIYYGILNPGKIADYSKYQFLIVGDKDFENISNVREEGCEVFQYIAFGSVFENTNRVIEDFKKEIDVLKNSNIADGIFLDECDLGYWEEDVYNQSDKVKIFYDRLKEVTVYAESIGLKTIVNGNKAYAELGDYYLWEDYLTYWESNNLNWRHINTGREENEAGTLKYGLQLSDWNLEGSCKLEEEYIVDGSNGSIDMTIDMDKILLPQDIKDKYDWGYTEWFGSGATDETCHVQVWVGNELPFNEATWESISDGYKGIPKYWNGINKSSKYLRLRMDFDGASDLKIKDILLTYGRTYGYGDMPIDKVKRDYLWEKIDETGNSVKILTHAFGEESDYNKNIYTYLTSKIWNYYSYDYVHPNMQGVYNTEKIDNPMGLLLKREGENKGYFTGAVATVDEGEQTYNLERIEPAYWYNEEITIDGNFDDWINVEPCYESDSQGAEIINSSWYISAENYSMGEFDNIQIVDGDGYDVLRLIEEGAGTWISPVISIEDDQDEVVMKEITWGGGGEGSINYYIQYKEDQEEWSDWIDTSKSASYRKINFTEFRVKIILEGVPSYVEEVEHDGISFWGSKHEWGTYVEDDIKQIAITDDRKNMYVVFEAEKEINFNKDEENEYSLFIDVNEATGADFKIENDKLFIWNEDENQWIENKKATVNYKLSGNKRKIEYGISKANLGGLEKQDFKLYMKMKNMENEKEYHFSYEQKNYEMKTPHGWYTSDEVVLDGKTKKVSLKWKEKIPSGTNVKAWVRTRDININWTNWIEVKNDKKVNTEKAIRYQYCFGLYTNDGKNTPIIDQIKVGRY